MKECVKVGDRVISLDERFNHEAGEVIDIYPSHSTGKMIAIVRLSEGRVYKATVEELTILQSVGEEQNEQCEGTITITREQFKSAVNRALSTENMPSDIDLSTKFLVGMSGWVASHLIEKELFGE